MWNLKNPKIYFFLANWSNEAVADAWNNCTSQIEIVVRAKGSNVERHATCVAFNIRGKLARYCTRVSRVQYLALIARDKIFL